MKLISELAKLGSLALITGTISAMVVMAVAAPSDLLGAASGKKVKKNKGGNSINELIRNDLAPKQDSNLQNKPTAQETFQAPNIAIPEPEVPALNKEYINELKINLQTNGPLLEPHNPGVCNDHTTSNSARGKVRRVRYDQFNSVNPTVCIIEIYPKGCDFLSTFVATYNLGAEPNGYSYKLATRACEAAEKAITHGTPVEAFGTEEGYEHLHRLTRFHLTDFN